MPAHLRNLDLPLSDFRQFAENRFVPDCSSVVTARTFVTVNLLIERFEMSVYITSLNYKYCHSICLIYKSIAMTTYHITFPLRQCDNARF